MGSEMCIRDRYTPGACFFLFFFVRALDVWDCYMLLTGDGTDARRAEDRTVLEVRHARRKEGVFFQGGGARPGRWTLLRYGH